MSIADIESTPKSKTSAQKSHVQNTTRLVVDIIEQSVDEHRVLNKFGSKGLAFSLFRSFRPFLVFSAESRLGRKGGRLMLCFCKAENANIGTLRGRYPASSYVCRYGVLRKKTQKRAIEMARLPKFRSIENFKRLGFAHGRA
ncbi:hypothetical protein [Hyphomicrobium sp.]|uniref:hypothetical protein n=1 Tax=Hyphomicrobium sp. TaxID=82 RepID=UPI001D3C3548|nr:hypothetical protein [Hyphomicrobium sp.]MBY0558522.1 hypothetical protein [Hyphomicrobium sp.]